MNSHEEILIELIENNDSEGIKELLNSNPDLESAYNDYKFIFNGFEAHRINELSTSLASRNNSEFGSEFDKGIQAMKVDALSQKLKDHDIVGSKKKGKVISLNRRILSIAASFLILASAAFWIFAPSNNDITISDFTQSAISINVRGDDYNPLVNDLNRLSNEGQWEELITRYESDSGSKSVAAEFHYAEALMRIENYKKAIQVLNTIQGYGLVQWSEMAEFNKMLCLYALENMSYKNVLDSIKSSEQHSLKKLTQEFELSIQD